MISIIIPTLNEEKALPTTLQFVFKQSGDIDKEVIVVDGGSTDNTRELALSNPDVELISAKRGRASQMNAGAMAANAEWLLFLHADTVLSATALQQIDSLTKYNYVKAGCFHQRFSKDHWFLRFVSWLHNWRCGYTSIMYGDQAMFIRRDFFHEIGGFPEEDMLEDVLFSERIIEKTKPVFLEDAVITSARKFEQRGLYRSFFDIFIIMSCYELRLPILRKTFFTAFR